MLPQAPTSDTTGWFARDAETKPPRDRTSQRSDIGWPGEWAPGRYVFRLATPTGAYVRYLGLEIGQLPGELEGSPTPSPSPSP